MADWNLLPPELLGKISGHLKASIDLLRFRSVCSSWRSAVPTNTGAPSSVSLPIPCHGVDPAVPGCLSKITVYLVSPLHSTTPRSWLVKIKSADASSTSRKYLLCPLSRYRFNPSFPRPLDLFDFRISELGHEYHLRANLERTHPLPSLLNFWVPRRVAITWLDGGSHFLLLAIFDLWDLAMYRSVDRQWTTIPKESHLYCDVIAYNENLYAVDKTGRTVRVGLNAELDLIANANPLLEGLDIYLVESKGQLLLVNLYTNEDYEYELLENQTTYESARVFTLDNESQSWIEVNCLDDQVLFLGEDSNFSASAADLSGCFSNCIFFSDSFGDDENSKEAGVLLGKTIGVFELGSDSAGLLRSYPQHAKMFWPPPDWLSSALLEEPTQNHSGGSSLIHDDHALELH